LEFLIFIVFGAICAMIAASKGRSPVGWFFIGLLAPVLGLILVLVLANLKENEERERRLRTENRRLRERVKKDRQMSDQRHTDTTARLSVHDRALGVDTAARLDTPEPQAELAPPPLPLDGDDDVRTLQWYFVGSDGRQGPFDFRTLQQYFEDGELQPETLVWCEAQSEWMPLRDRRDLQEALIA
jgi:hypothetical protein